VRGASAFAAAAISRSLEEVKLATTLARASRLAKVISPLAPSVNVPGSVTARKRVKSTCLGLGLGLGSGLGLGLGLARGRRSA